MGINAAKAILFAASFVFCRSGSLLGCRGLVFVVG